MRLTPVSRQSTSDAVFEQLAAEILRGSLSPGDPLPAERILTEELQVNRGAIREALKRLDQAGLVDIRHGESTRVRDFMSSAGLDLLPRLLLTPDGHVDATVVRSVMEMRATIGPDAAAYCAARQPSAAKDLRRILVAMDAAGDDVSAVARLDLDFWDQTVRASGNVAYRLAFNSLRRAYEPVLEFVAHAVAPEIVNRADHAEMADAIAAGDPAGARLAAARLLSSDPEHVVHLLDALLDAVRNVDGELQEDRS